MPGIGLATVMPKGPFRRLATIGMRPIPQARARLTARHEAARGAGRANHILRFLYI